MRVLVAEDEFVTAMWLRAELEARGLTVLRVCSRGRQVIESARQDRPDLLLLDIHLQDEIDGIAAAEAIGDIPVIYASAYADTETMSRAQATNPLAFLSKPINIDILTSVIEKHSN
jgi:CheY-like chemotaxis protein